MGVVPQKGEKIAREGLVDNDEVGLEEPWSALGGGLGPLPSAAEQAELFCGKGVERGDQARDRRHPFRYLGNLPRKRQR